MEVLAEKEYGPLSLEKEGWTRQFVACEPRLSEAVQMYEELGFEVCLEPLPPVPLPNEDPGTRDGECGRCYRGVEDRYRIIYTRPKKVQG